MAGLGSSSLAVAESLNIPREVFCVKKLPNDVSKLCRVALENAEYSAEEGLGNVENCLVPELDLFTVTHEEAQLRCAQEAPQTARNGVVYDERDCARGEECVAMTLAGGPGKPLMECLGPQNYYSAKEFGTLPMVREPCVLCRRDAVGMAVTEMALKTSEEHEEPFRLCQVYRNQCFPDNDPQTYRAECCLHPAQIGKRWNGLVGPVVIFDKSYYSWNYNSELNVFCIDQSLVVNTRKIR